ncbi:ArsR/SmtB family transcription factor [Actinopolymorpha alba]|uniref:ArsR/SmtB family transcription factor n=1 Tax=Actinopolymorpha alba TaxID=533267 RepID=UPI00035E638A|nr:metalloregulator ArsR/SmtB family transcription factor [Actinopolymorpha alba]
MRDLTQVHESVCYDLLGSLRALYSPRTYPARRGWVSATRKSLPAELYESGRFFFQGHDTSVGFGAVRLVPELPDGAGPEELIARVREVDPKTLAEYMLDAAGDTTPSQLAAFRRILDGEGSRARVASALRGFASTRKRRYQRILEDPAGLQNELATMLAAYHELSFADQADALREPLAVAVKVARETLRVLPTAKAVEQLSGGLALSADWPLTRLTLAPSVFLHPFVSVRVDEKTGEALIVYGVPSEGPDTYDTVPVDESLLRALKAMSDPARLQILRLLSEQPISAPQLVERIGLSQPTVHHHVAALRAAELVRQERTRSGMLLSLRDDGVARTLSALSAVFNATPDE